MSGVNPIFFVFVVLSMPLLVVHFFTVRKLMCYLSENGIDLPARKSRFSRLLPPLHDDIEKIWRGDLGPYKDDKELQSLMARARFILWTLNFLFIGSFLGGIIYNVLVRY